MKRAISSSYYYYGHFLNAFFPSYNLIRLGSLAGGLSKYLRKPTRRPAKSSRTPLASQSPVAFQPARPFPKSARRPGAGSEAADGVATRTDGELSCQTVLGSGHRQSGRGCVPHCTAFPGFGSLFGKKRQFSFSTKHSGKPVQLYGIINYLNLVILERKE